MCQNDGECKRDTCGLEFFEQRIYTMANIFSNFYALHLILLILVKYRMITMTIVRTGF